MIQLYWPGSTGEWLAFVSAAVTVLFGVLGTFAYFRFKLRTRTPGFGIGVGLAALVLAQPLVYLALGAGLAFSALGQFVSLLVTWRELASQPLRRAGEVGGFIGLVLLAAGPLLFALGYIP